MKDYILGNEMMTIGLSQEQRNDILKTLSTDLTNLIEHLRSFKSEDRSELNRRFAIAITEAEKLDGYITQYILSPVGSNE